MSLLPVIIPVWRMSARWLRLAVGARVSPATPHLLPGRVEKRSLAVRVAVWTKPMRWFGAALVWLQHVSHGPVPGWLKFVILLLSIPCFKISHFCFKRAYALSLRRVSLAGAIAFSIVSSTTS